MNMNKTASKFKYGYPKAVHDLAEGYIQNEILKCETQLVTDLLGVAYQSNASELSNEFILENIDNFFDTSVETIEEFLTYNTNDDSWTELSFDEKEILAEQLGFEPQPHEIFEWWAVSNWLSIRLAEIGQPILNNAYGQWWGRTCSGQAIILDGTLQKIAEQYR
jgi:hypothetical protein